MLLSTCFGLPGCHAKASSGRLSSSQCRRSSAFGSSPEGSIFSVTNVQPRRQDNDEANREAWNALVDHGGASCFRQVPTITKGPDHAVLRAWTGVADEVVPGMLQRLSDLEAAERTRVFTRAMHNVYSKGRPYLWKDFLKHIKDTPLPKDVTSALSTMHDWGDFHYRLEQQYPTKDALPLDKTTKRQLVSLVRDFAKANQLPRAFWTSALQTRRLNGSRNDTEHGDVAAHVKLLRQELAKEQLPEELLEVREMLLALALSTERHLPDILQARQDYQKRWRDLRKLAEEDD